AEVLYGRHHVPSQPDDRPGLTNVKEFARRIGVTYEEVIALLKTQFINPASTLIPRLERLGVPFAKLKALHDGAISIDDFGNLLPPRLDPAAYGGDPAALAEDGSNYAHVMGGIL